MSIPLIQACQWRSLGGVTAAGTTTVNYDIDLQLQSKTFVPPFPGAMNVNPTQTYTAPATTLGSQEFRNEGGDQVVFVVHLGAVVTGSVVTVSCYKTDDASGTNPVLMNSVSFATAQIATAALTGTTDDNKLILLNVNRPNSRYMRLTVARATQNAAINSVQMVMGDLARTPSHQSSTVIAQKVAFAA